jgi:hypothetical protein
MEQDAFKYRSVFVLPLLAAPKGSLLGMDARVSSYKDVVGVWKFCASAAHSSQWFVEGSIQIQQLSEKMHHLIGVGIREFGTWDWQPAKPRVIESS